MKQKYEPAEMEIIFFSVEDIITTSSGSGSKEEGEGEFDNFG